MGGETLEVDLGSNAVFDAAGNAAAANQTSSNTATLNDESGPVISSVSLDGSNGFIDVTFNEGIFNTGAGSGAVEGSDFSLSITGGTATSPSVTSVTTTGGAGLSGGETTIRVNFTVTGTPDGGETLEVDITDGSSIFDAAGNAAAANQTSSNTASMNDAVVPSISSVSLDGSNGFIDVTFNEGVFNTGGGSGAVESSDFDLSLTGGTATSPTVTSVTTTGGAGLSGGETTIRVNFSVTGTPDGGETLEVDITDGSSIFDAAGNAAAANQTSSNTASMNDATSPAISSVSLAADNGHIDVTFSEGVFDTNGGSGALEASDFSLSLTGGTATSPTVTTVTTTGGGALSGGETTIRVNFSVTGTPDGGETLEVDLGSNAVFDAAANAAAANQTSSNTASMNDATAPTLDGASSTPADDATGVLLGSDIVLDFSENIAVGTGNITLKEVGGSNIQQFNIAVASATSSPTAGNVGVLNDKVYINPSADLSAETSYAIQIDATAIDDANSNSFAGISNDTDFNFTTVPNLIITEIMFNPANSGEGDWEWVEVYNAGSSSADLSNYILDDDDASALGSANIASGTIAAGTSAILHSNNLSSANFEAAWGTGITLIPVSNFPTLSNGGDRVGLWAKLSDYTSDKATHNNTISSVNYGAGGFPTTQDGKSIYLTNLANDNTVGSNWANSSDGGSTPLNKGYTSVATSGLTNDNSGADIGSPGTGFPATISSVSLAADNSYIDVTFNEGVYNTNSVSGGLEASDFTLGLAGGTATSPTISSVKKNDSAVEGSATALAGNETVIRVFFSYAGTADGGETLTISPASNSIFDAEGSASSTSQTGNTATLNDQTGPSISSVSLAADNGYIDVTFNEGVFDTNGGSGAIETGDFSLSIIGGTATSPIVTSVTTTGGAGLSGGETTIRVSFSTTGSASGAETIEVDITDGSSVFDAAGNAAAANQTANNTATMNDATAPAFSSVSPSSSSTVNTANVGYTLSEAIASGTVTFTRTSGTADASSPHTVSLTGTELNAGTRASAALTNAPTLVDGAVYTVSFDGQDAAGNNATTISSTSVTFDNTAPTIAISTPIEGDGVVNASEDGDVTISGSTTGTEDGQTVSISLSDGSNPAVTGTATVVSNAWTITTDADISGLNDGTITITADVSDQAGNAATQASQIVTLDNGVPTVVVSTPSSAISVNAPNQNVSGTSNEDGATVNVYADDNNDGVADNASSLGSATVSSGAWSISVSLTADQANNFVVQASDAAGNTSGDVDVPTITEDSSDPASPVITTPASAISVNAASQTVSGTHSEDGVTVNLYADVDNDGLIDNLTPLGSSTVSGGVWSIPASLTADDENNFIVRAEDAAGNTSGEVDVPTITEDSTAPTITISTPIEGDGIVETAESSDVEISGTTVGVEDGQSVTVSFSDGSTTAGPVNATVISNAWTASLADISALNDGNITVTADVSDLAGNAATQASQTIVLDQAPPTISATSPADGTTDVGIQSSLTITFNENVSFGTGNIQLIDLTDNSGDITIDAASPGSAASISGAVLTIANPSGFLEEATNYAVQIASTAIQDGGGNSFAGITDNTTFNFSTTAAPVVSISDVAAVNEGDAGSTNLDFTVSLDKASPKTITIDYSTVDNTATSADSDFTSVSGTLTFNPSETSKTITVVVTGDSKVESTESFSLVGTNPTNATFADNQGDATITNDDAATVAIADVTQNEGSSGTTTYTFTATLTGEVDQAFTVDYATVDGTATTASGDYTASSGTLNFAGTDGETQTFSVIVAGDALVESDENFTAVLSNLQAGGKSVTIATATGTGTITNDDAATISIDDVTKAENADGGASTNFVFTVTLDKAVDTGFTVDFGTGGNTATTADNDYVSTTGQLTFVGTAGETQTITVTVNDDEKVEQDETFGVQLSNLQAGGNSVTIADADGVGTITNDDAATITIADVSGNEDDGTITLTATLDKAVDTGFQITVQSTDGSATTGSSDYAALNQNLTFAGTAGETQQFTITPTADQVLESDETLTVSVTGTTSTLTLDISDNAIVTIQNDDSATLSIVDVTKAEGNSGTTAFTFDVTLTGAVDQQVTVDFATSDGTATTADSDYAAASGTLTFAGTDGEIEQITVNVTGDTNEESDENFLVTLSNIGDNNKGVAFAGSDNQATGTITNEDDNTAPTGFTVTLSDTEINAAEASAVGFTFAGAEVGTTYNYSITSSGGGTAVTGTGTIATATDAISGIDVSGLSDGTLTLSVTLTDSFSNESTAQTDTAALDQTAPTGTTVETISTDTGDANNDAITNDNTLSFSGTAEAGSTVEVFIDLVSIGTTTATNAGEWTFDHTGTTLRDAVFRITAKATDAFGNVGAQGAALRVEVDTRIPQASLTTAAPSLINASIIATITFDEVLSNFDISDVTVTNGTASEFTAVIAGQAWSVRATPTTDGTMTVQVPAGAANDVAGNGNTASNTLTFTFDGTDPTVSAITRADASPTQAQQVDFDVVFSEDVNNVDATDFEIPVTGTITGATVSSVTQVTAATYTVTVDRGTGEGTFGLNVKDDDTIVDDANNALGGVGLGNADFTGEIYNTNNSPTDITLSASAIDENNALSAVVATLTTTDADAGDTFTYSLASGTGDDDNASFLAAGDELIALVSFNFETKASYSVRLETDDGKGGTYQEAFTITINDVNEVATSVELSNSSIDEADEPVLVGSLSTLGDPDVNESFTYAVNPAAGGDNNLLFTVTNGNELRTTAATNFEENTTLTVGITSTDSGGNTVDQVFTITIRDVQIEDLRNFDKDESDARVKNFFTPNGDGTNDTWVVEDILDNPINEVKVYSQAGKLIFSQRNYENDWDGTFDGEPIPPGTYYYEINIYNGESIIRGFLTIIRN